MEQNILELPSRHRSLQRYRFSLHSCVAAIFLAAGLFVLITTAGIIVLGYTPLVIGDQWNYLTIDELLGSLFQQHAEHRIVVPKLLLTLDLLFDSYRNRISVALIFVTLLLQCGVIAKLCCENNSAVRDKMLSIGFILIVMTSAYHGGNLLWGFQIAFVAEYFFVVLAFYLICLPSRSTPTFIGSALAAALASFTMANGLLVMPMAAGLAVVRARPTKQILTLGIGSILIITAYLWRFHFIPYHSNPFETILNPRQVLQYIFTFIGGPLSIPGGQWHVLTESFRNGPILIPEAHSRELFATVFGFISIILTLGVIFLSRMHKSPSYYTLAAIALFVLASAFITALGRLNFGNGEAMNYRYATPALLFFCCSGLLFFENRPILPPLISGLALGFLVWGTAQFVVAQPYYAKLWVLQADFRQLAANALLSAVYDVNATNNALPNFPVIKARIGLLQSERFSIFAEDFSFIKDAPFVRGEEFCSGAFEYQAPVPNTEGMRVGGWAWDQRHRRPIERVVLLDGRTAIGFASRIRSTSQGFNRWQGYSRMAKGQLRAFGVIDFDGKKSLCEIGDYSSAKSN